VEIGVEGVVRHDLNQQFIVLNVVLYIEELFPRSYLWILLLCNNLIEVSVAYRFHDVAMDLSEYGLLIPSFYCSYQGLRTA
jgi:hypothetical protein